MSKIHSELRTVFITPDGYKFFSKHEAEMHCEEFNLITKQGDNDEEI